jgi:hypothetical protein
MPCSFSEIAGDASANKHAMDDELVFGYAEGEVMATFRKKPVEVEAEQFHQDKFPLPFRYTTACCLGPNGWYVTTAHGQQAALADGDWVIREPDNRGFYPCKPDIFAATYELVATPEEQE